MKKNTLYLILAFLILYFSGIGSSVFPNFETNATKKSGDALTSIVVSPPKKTVTEESVKDYAVLLTKNFKFANGSVGKIEYFYGGKAKNLAANGLDPDFNVPTWGTNSSGGKFFEPYGLDCSGYTSYIMYLAGIRDFPHGSSKQYALGDSIPLSEAGTGDLLIYRDAKSNKITHIGFVLLHNGRLYDAHCNAADNGVSIREVKAIGPKKDGHYWQEVVKNPYVEH